MSASLFRLVSIQKETKIYVRYEKVEDETYMETMREKIPFINTEIVKLPQPIDLYKAYGAYNFGIYKNIN
ncbi:hypothetical protein [Solobacterium moorei]